VRFIDLESELIKFLGFVLLFVISLAVVSLYLAQKQQRQGVEVIKANGTKTIACSNGIFIVGSVITAGREYILKKGDWSVSETTPFKVVWEKEGRRFHPEDCRVIEEENEHE